MNFPRFIRDLAILSGIPESHLSAIVHRFLAAKKAADQLAEFKASSSPDLNSLERSLEREDRKLANRIVEAAIEDYRQGMLERRC